MNMETKRILLIILVCVILIVGVVIFFIVRGKILDTKIFRYSKKINALQEINRGEKFHNIQDRFEIKKFYDNKRNYNNVQPAGIMAHYITNNMEYFSDYFKKIQENSQRFIEYNKKISAIKSMVEKEESERLKISLKEYFWRENRIFEKEKLTPTVNCFFSVQQRYSSRKGRVNLFKSGTYGFNEMYACFESISRTRLDRKTYLELATVERGELSDSLRYDIMRRDNFKCVICGASADIGARLHVDHIIPIAKGGKTVPNNLRVLCERCNIGKSDKMEAVESEKLKETANICSRCGAPMLLRKGKYGQFYGCSNYPRCKHTEQIAR